MGDINKNLQHYVEMLIFPLYSFNEQAHDINHIKYVLDRSFELVKDNNLEVDANKVYTIAAYHDIGHHIDPVNHEILSACMMYEDDALETFFSEQELLEMKHAIEDHRANLNVEPRSIYGKIISSADRNNSIELCIIRTYFYGKKHFPQYSNEELFERSYNFITNKFGTDGYAKFYFKDQKYEDFLREIRLLLSDKENFLNQYKQTIEKVLIKK